MRCRRQTPAWPRRFSSPRALRPALDRLVSFRCTAASQIPTLCASAEVYVTKDLPPGKQRRNYKEERVDIEVSDLRSLHQQPRLEVGGFQVVSFQPPPGIDYADEEQACAALISLPLLWSP